MDMFKIFQNICFQILVKVLRKRLRIFVLLLSCVFVTTMYKLLMIRTRETFFHSDETYTNSSFPFLLSAFQGQSCARPILDPYHSSVIKFFHKVPKLKCDIEPNWIMTRNGIIQILPEAEERHDKIRCRMSNINRLTSDSIFKYGPTLNIQKGKKNLSSDFVKTSCISKSGQKYMNIHSTIAYNQTIFDRLNKRSSKNTSHFKLSVIMLGFDSVSKNTWIRMLPSSYKYFKSILKGTVLEGYNIVGDGTPQALFPILTGRTEEELPEARRDYPGSSFVDSHPWIWRKFSELGYVTQWGEDMAFIGTFNLRMKGFKYQPVDHYMRPFYLITEKLHRFFKPYCIGSQPRHRVMFNYLKDFVEMYKEHPKFSFLFHSEYSHHDSNHLQWLDGDLTNLLEYLNDNGHLNSSVLILMSDHGARFHEIRQTLQGKFEERLPFFAFRFPDWFSKIYPNEYKNLQINANKLVTPFDIHATFEHLINIMTVSNKSNPFMSNEQKARRSISILKNIPKDRSCYDAGIAAHWCTCLPWKITNIDNDIVKNGARNVVNFINSLTQEFRHLCYVFSLFKIIRALTFSPSADVIQYTGSKDKDGRHAKFNTSITIQSSMLQITFQVSPGDAIYEATVIYNKLSKMFFVNNHEISRTNSYGSTADCIANIAPNIRQYCFCI